MTAASTHPVTAYLALGANLGDRARALREAAERLHDGATVFVEAMSPLYETVAVTALPQPDYLNAVVRVGTQLSPRALLDHALAIETAMGRVRPSQPAKAPRTIDIDLLLHGDSIVREAGLRVPHPGMLTRAFVLIPLAQVAEPGLRHPETGTLLDRLTTDAGVRMYRSRPTTSP